ncbi:hypothetical protein AB832_03240 [Flavobacteriaceae bacterium (ex Bugula neritina AB1)]|nr:hypothetical protein AB832_03240 [Flavobacteriaceae bacterium (ex Bugula neritina AB1)]
MPKSIFYKHTFKQLETEVKHPLKTLLQKQENVPGGHPSYPPLMLFCSTLLKIFPNVKIGFFIM